VETSSPTNRAAGAQGMQALHADKSALHNKTNWRSNKLNHRNDDGGGAQSCATHSLTKHPSRQLDAYIAELGMQLLSERKVPTE
jgi:hypothetical protein